MRFEDRSKSYPNSGRRTFRVLGIRCAAVAAILQAVCLRHTGLEKERQAATAIFHISGWMARSRPAVAARRDWPDVGHSRRNLFDRLAQSHHLDLHRRPAGSVRGDCAARRVYDSSCRLVRGARSDRHRSILDSRPQPKPLRCIAADGACCRRRGRRRIPGSRGDVCRCAPVWTARDHYSSRIAIH